MNAKEAVFLAAAGAVAVYLAYTAARKGLAAAADAVNPTSDKNLAYRGVNSIGEALTGDPSWSLGSWLYDQFNPPYDPNAPEPTTRKQQVGALSNFFSQFSKEG